ncbi:hypothetical protein CR513_33448, partial [Mucuna pruriens]
MGITPPHDVLQSDRFIWTLKPDVNFSTKTTYRLLKRNDNVRAHEVCRKIWDKIFTYMIVILKVVYNDILTNVLDKVELYVIMHFALYVTWEDETIIHVLRDCMNGKLVWQNISPNLLGRISIVELYVGLFGREHDKMFNILWTKVNTDTSMRANEVAHYLASLTHNRKLGLDILDRPSFLLKM